ncbi:hypothetical protein RB653_010467 [Dictyostelium firmibasis]|uniref:Uncharacterized protein n=1 Tax=Dictyostelium firmibasis TaxID=79012 RepID=A0AAN7YPV5_9MYCE
MISKPNSKSIFYITLIIFYIGIVKSQYFPLDPGASCQKYIGDSSGIQLCDGFLGNPDSIYINSTSTQEAIQAQGNLIRAYINIYKNDEKCKNSRTFALLCAFLFPECDKYTDPVSKKIYAYPILPCYENCINMTSSCQISSRLSCSTKYSANNISYSVFPKNTTTYKINSSNFTNTCENTNLVANSQNTTVQQCFQPLVYHVSKNQTYDKSIGYVFPTANSTCVVQCPAPLYYMNEWRNIYRLSDVLSILSCILTLFLVITLGIINPKVSKFDKINIMLLACIFLQAFSGALMTFNGTEHTLCPEPGRFASYIDRMCVATGFLLHGSSLLVVQWWCVLSFEVWITVFQVGKKQKDRFIYYLVSSLVIAWVPPIVSISKNEYSGGPANPFCWLTSFNYRRFAFWLPMGFFLCLGGIFLILLIREIYLIVSDNVKTTKESRIKILRMEVKPIISLVMYFSCLLYLFIYDQWINNHMYIYTDSIPSYALCLLTSPDATNCLLKAPNIAGFGYFIYSIRVFGIYAFIIYGVSKKTIHIWKYNYFVIFIGQKLEQFTNATTTAKSSNSNNSSSATNNNISVKATSNMETRDEDDSNSVELDSNSDCQ